MKDRNPNSVCEICGEKFYAQPCRNAKFCSKKCMGVSKQGKKDPNLKARPIGTVPWNKGLNRVEITCEQCGESFSDCLSQERRFCSVKCANDAVRHSWDKMNYAAKHHYVRVHFGIIKQCENCGTKHSPKFEWANISGEYRQGRDDWKGLCCQCHRRFDFGVTNKIEL